MGDDYEQQVRPDLVIKATKGWRRLHLNEFWQYRHLLKVMVIRNFQSRYRQMALGPLWIILQPIVNMVIFSILFGKLAKLPSHGIPYPVFTFAALLPWTYFSRAVTESSNSLVANMRLMTRLYFPRMLSPLSVVISSLLDFLMSFSVLVAMMIYYQVCPSWGIIFVPILILYTALMAMAVSLWTSALQVYFRDMHFLVSYLMQLWMYVTPVAYSAEIIPERFALLYKLNPMYWVIQGFRWALLNMELSPDPTLFISLGLSLVFLISGAFVFRRSEKTIVDVL